MPIEKKKNNLFMKFISRYIVYLGVLLVVVLITVGFVFVLWPKWNSHKNNPELTLAYHQEALKTRQEKLNQLNDLIADYKNLPASHFKKINELLPSANEAPILFTHLSGLAKLNNTVLMNVTANDVGDRDLTTLLVTEGITTPKNLKVVDVAATFLGKTEVDNYSYFKQLVKAIQQNVRLFDIQYIIFTPSLTNFSFNARTYYLENNE